MTPNLHRLLSLAILLVFVGIGYYLVAEVWLDRYQYYRDTIEQSQDRLQRYHRIAASRPELERALRAINQDQSAETYYLDQTAPNLAATELQQQVKNIVQANGGRIASSQVLPYSQEGGFTVVPIRVQLLVTDMASLQKSLHALESAKPILFVDNVQMRARQVRKRQPVARNLSRAERRAQRRTRRQIVTETQLTAQFELAGYIRNGDGA